MKNQEIRAGIRQSSVAVCAALAAALSLLPAQGADQTAPSAAKTPPSTGKIQFSDRSDRVLIPKPARQSDNYEGPARSGGSGSELQGPGFTAPQAQGPAYDAKKVQDLLDKEKNWIFNKPEDFGKDPSVEEILGVEEVGRAPKEEYSSRFERFIKEGPEQIGKTRQERDRDVDNEDAEGENLDGATEGGGLSEDVSLRYLLDQEKRDNSGAVDNASDKRDRSLLVSPMQKLGQQSFLRNPNDRTQGDPKLQSRTIDVAKMIADPNKATADSAGAAKNGFRQSYTPSFARQTKDMDSILESTREPLAAPAGTRAGGLEALRTTAGFNAGARAVAPAPVQEEYKRPEYKPGVLPIPRRTF